MFIRIFPEERADRFLPALRFLHEWIAASRTQPEEENNEGGAARYGATYGRASPPRKQAERSNLGASCLLVAKLRGARERKRAEPGRCEGRKSWAEINLDLFAKPPIQLEWRPPRSEPPAWQAASRLRHHALPFEGHNG